MTGPAPPARRALLVIAHPLDASLCRRLAASAAAALGERGRAVEIEDLHRPPFDPRLTAAERASYYGAAFGAEFDAGYAERLTSADELVLVFPTWWFGFPAILKGWFDRVWAPGVAYDHAADLGAIRPRLARLRAVLAITTLGAPWWVDRLVMGRPVERVLRRAIIGACAPQARLRCLSLHGAEKVSEARIAAFEHRVRRAVAAL